MRCLHARFAWWHDCEAVIGKTRYYVGRERELVRLNADAHTTHVSVAWWFALLMSRYPARTSLSPLADSISRVLRVTLVSGLQRSKGRRLLATGPIATRCRQGGRDS